MTPPDNSDQPQTAFIPVGQTPDLTNCDREPIHIPGSIQPVGFLIAVSSDWIVTFHSVNVGTYLPSLPSELLGERLDILIDTEALKQVNAHLQELTHDEAVERILDCDFLGNGTCFDITVHRSAQHILIEGEPADGQKIDVSAQLSTLINRINNTRSLTQLCDIAAQQIKSLIAFDRAMIYRFDQDGAGEVIAEAREAHLESYLNLHYPASDIPRQARILYKRNLVRFISDVGMKVVPVVPTTGPDKQPLDMSLAALRAVSPIHLEYLGNMGVEASFSISIIVRGELWGLIACHHYSPRHLSSRLRATAELFAQVFSLMVERSEHEEQLHHEHRARIVHDKIMAHMTGSRSLLDHFDTISRMLTEIIPHDGIGVCIDGECELRGITPTVAAFHDLTRFLNRTAASRIYSTHELSAVYDRAGDLGDHVAGLLAIPVSRKPRDYIVLFRQEISKSVQWAGNPQKPVTAGPNGLRLTPRKSFEAWQETVTGQSSPWNAGELTAAESIRGTFLEVVLRMAHAAETERMRASERQELLIAELNHRVRNILNLIKSLVNQSRRTTKTAESFAATITGRIHALARAHDQVTEQQWGPGSLTSLVHTEAEAFALRKKARVSCVGPDVMINPTAFTTLSLVIHELMTNSMKYGSLSDSAGTIVITVVPQKDNSIEILWQEKNGPAVTPPVERGFGSIIIENSVPYELGGEASVEYHSTGLRGKFVIPSEHIHEISNSSVANNPSAGSKDGHKNAYIKGHVLILEDNMIIAMDAEDMIRNLGANDVTTRTNCKAALNAIAKQAPDFAILDINLGPETCLPVAEKLSELGVRFIFTTGYGQHNELTERFGNPAISKPYGKDDLLAGLDRIGVVMTN